MRVPGGGASCLGVGRPGTGALPPRPLVRPGVRPGPTTHWLWVRGVRAWGPVTSPTARTLASWLCALWGRHEGARGGAPPAWVWSVRGRTLSHPRPLVRPGVRPGPTTHWLWVRGVRAWGPVTNPTARTLASWLCALWGRHEGARGGRLLPGCGASGVGCSPSPNHSSVWACGRGPLPTGCGCGGCGHGDPSPTPQRALLRAGFARCGGRRRVPGGGASCLGAGHLGSGALPPPTSRPSGRAAGAHYPLAVGAGGAGVGTRHQPHSCALASWLCALGGRHESARGGAPLAWVWGVRGRALSHPRPRVRPGVRPGPTTHWLWVRGVRAWGPVTNPTARTLASWLCALWGRHEGARGGRLLPGCGASGVGRSPTPDHSSVRACGRGPLPTGCGCGGCGRGDPSPTPQRALLRAGFARCGGGMRVPGGGASCLGVGRPGSGALPAPTTRPFGRAAGAHYPLAVGARGAGMGTRHQPHSARSCELALRAVGAAGGCPGGAPPAWVRGIRGRALSHPRPLVRPGVRPGPTTHWLWVRGVRAWGPVTNPTAALLRAGFARWGGGMRVPGGGRLLPGCGASGDGRSPTRDLASVRGCGRGPLPTGCGCGGCGRGDPSPTPQRALLRAGFARCGGGMRVPGGGTSCLGVGRLGSDALQAPTTRPSGRAAGAHYPLAVGAGGAGVGTRHQPHSAHSCELALRAVGAA